MGPAGPSGVVMVAKAWGVGFNPSSALNFIGPTVTVDVMAGESVLVNASKALGSIAAGGGTGLSLNICYQPAGGDPTAVDATGIIGLRVPANTRVLQSLSTEITGLSGTNVIGMCGSSTNFTSWNDNSAGSIVAIVVTPGT